MSKKKSITSSYVKGYVKEFFPDKTNKDIWEFVLDAVVSHKDFLDTAKYLEETINKLNVENKVTYHPAPTVLPSSGDEYDFFPSVDGRLVETGGDC